MGYACYQVGKRDGGYGVPAHCEYPSCRRVIDRGMPYACGGEPFSEHGCDRYFCSKHLTIGYFQPDGELCDCPVGDCACDMIEVCERCARGEASFPYKPEHKTWMRWKLKDPSWEQWRKDYPETVAEYKKALSVK